MTNSGTASIGPPQAAPSNRHGRSALVLAVIAGVSLMIVLDGTTVTIALPKMGQYFHRDQTDMTWARNVYTLAFGGLLLLGGRSADRFGRRRMMMIGVGLFAVGSLAGGLATSFEFLLAGRAIEGIGAAIASPTALSLLSTDFAEGPVRNRAIALYAAVSMAGAALGLLLAGALTDYLSWRWVLIVNVPVGVALVLATYYFVGDAEAPGRKLGGIDVVGSVVSVAGLGGLVYGFIHAADHGWLNTQTILVLAISVALLMAFVLHEAFMAAEPILPLHLFRNRDRAVAYLVILIVGAAIFGTFYFISFFAQGVLGYSALRAGCAFLPAIVLIGVSSQVSALLLPRLGAKRLLLAGAVLLTVALAWLSRVSADTGYLDTVLPATIIVGIGLGATFVPLTQLVVSGLADTEAGRASAVLNVGQQVGGSIGLAVLANLASNAATDAGTTSAINLIKQYGLASPHVRNYAALAQAYGEGTVAPAAARMDKIADHALDAVGASAAAAGFLAAALFAAGAVVVTLIGLRARRPSSTLDDVDRETAT